MEKTNKVLVAVNLGINLGKKKSILFAGDWCEKKKYTEKIINREHEFFPSIFDKDNLLQFKKEITRIRNIIQPILFEKLNLIHNTNFKKKFWNLIVDPWLGNYLAYNYVRWHTIESILKSNKNVNFEFDTFELEAKSFVSYDLQSSFITPNLSSDVYNQFFYQKVIEYFKDLNNISIVKNNEKIFYETKKVYKFNNLNFYLRKIFNSIKKKFIYKNRVYLNAYEINRLELVKINIALKQFPINPGFFFSEKTFKTLISKDLMNYDVDLRNKINFEDKNNFSFENFIVTRIKYDLPNYLVENFDKIIKYLKNLNFHQKYIVTGGDHFYNILFKFWMALNKDKESKILTLDHGIHNGVEKGDIYYQEEIGDINIGFYKQMKSKEIQLPSIRLSKYIDLREKKSKPEKLLFVSYDSMIYPENILISPICSKSKYVIEYFEVLTKHLDRDILNKTLIRPTFKKHYPFSWVKDEMINKFSKKFKIIENNYFNNFKNSKVVVCTYPQTSFAEALISGPALLLTKLNYWPYFDKFVKLKEELIDAKIIFESPKEAAKHINGIWNNPYIWWESKKVENAKKRFINETALVSEKALEKFVNYLKTLN